MSVAMLCNELKFQYPGCSIVPFSRFACIDIASKVKSIFIVDDKSFDISAEVSAVKDCVKNILDNYEQVFIVDLKKKRIWSSFEIASANAVIADASPSAENPEKEISGWQYEGKRSLNELQDIVGDAFKQFQEDPQCSLM